MARDSGDLSIKEQFEQLQEQLNKEIATIEQFRI